MQISRGRVVSVSTGHIGVVLDAPPPCARCASGQGCGAGLLGTNRPRQQVDVEYPTDLLVKPGDEVELSLTPNNVLVAAATVYGLPLAGGIIGAATAWSLGLEDFGAALVAFCGLAGGFFLARQRLRRDQCLRDFTPAITGLVHGTGSC